jgi:hypothetical protein
VSSERLAQEAAALEHGAEEYPDQRGEILLEASTAWRRAGDDSRADQLLESLVEAGGEDAAYARVELASNAFDKGDRAAAAACLDRLAKDPELHDGHCQLAAELLASHGDLPGALRWYDPFVSRLPDEQLAALDGPDGWLTFAAIPLRARRQLREQLGFPNTPAKSQARWKRRWPGSTRPPTPCHLTRIERQAPPVQGAVQGQFRPGTGSSGPAHHPWGGRGRSWWDRAGVKVLVHRSSVPGRTDTVRATSPSR